MTTHLRDSNDFLTLVSPHTVISEEEHPFGVNHPEVDFEEPLPVNNDHYAKEQELTPAEDPYHKVIASFLAFDK